ncbi:MAG: 2Fe-2S iron-sulfur cluster-binding protein [Lautropia sp.]
MTRIVFEWASGERREIDVEPGAVLMHAALAEGIDGIVAECGGAAACGTCHVYADSRTLARLPSIESNEEAMLDFTAEPRQHDSRLSCQIRVTEDMDGAIFRIPARQL